MGVDLHAHVAASLAFPLGRAPLRGQGQLHHHPVGFLTILRHVATQVIHLPVTVAATQHHCPRLGQSAAAGDLQTHRGMRAEHCPSGARKSTVYEGCYPLSPFILSFREKVRKDDDGVTVSILRQP